MARYIDADKLLEKLCDTKIAGFGEFHEGVCQAREIVKEMPAVDVEEVRHGYWKMWNYPGDEHVECSECHTQYYENDLYLGGNEFPKRCPECGAKMEER